MAKRKQRPTWITDKVEEEAVFCKDCNIESRCGILRDANARSHSKGGNNINHEWGCIWLQEKNGS